MALIQSCGSRFVMEQTRGRHCGLDNRVLSETTCQKIENLTPYRLEGRLESKTFISKMLKKPLFLSVNDK